MFYILTGCIVLSLVAYLVIPGSEILAKILLAGFLMIFMAYLVIDIHLILGRGDYALTIDDSVLGAMLIYGGIINIFLSLLQLTQSRD